ncbi:RTP1/Tango6 family protein [Aspergillus lucknowensis]|uniref:Protein required for cell viability n=1 Tax=Aspergillus lucknowensis TaxID=176173 RepID=A0ABR4M2Z2_9EURO
MGDRSTVKEAFAAASNFLGPVLQRDELQRSRGKSLIEILDNGITETSSDARLRVIGKALDLLHQIHVAFAIPVIDADQISHAHDHGKDPNLEDAKRRRVLHALLDLISLEGIYPSLSSGVGIPLQKRVISVLPAGVIAQQYTPVYEDPQNGSLLRRILATLSEILVDARPSIQPVIRSRILSDIISALSDLGFNPKVSHDDGRHQYQQLLSKVVEDTSSPDLLSTLSAFLQANPTSWFKAVVTRFLSKIPLRPNGVIQTIVFLASQFAPSLGQEVQDQAARGPHITVNAIMHASRLLSSVPQEMEAAFYFRAIGPQLLALIDGDDPDLRKAAAYIVGNGILGKRAYGTPGAVGHSIFLEPIFKTLTGTLDESSRVYMVAPREEQTPISKQVLATEAEILLAIGRLRTLVLQPPNPGLVKRVVYPILLPLWGLACFSIQQSHTGLYDDIMAVLQTYFGISVGFLPFKKIIDNFLWDGGSACTYDTNTKNNILLKMRTAKESEIDLVGLVDTLEARTKLFMSLLDADPNRDEQTSETFLYVSETWLVHPSSWGHTSDKLKLLSDNRDSDNIIRRLVSAKLAEALLDNFKDTLSRRPLKVLELIKHIIDGELRRATVQREEAGKGNSGHLSLSSLANIVHPQEAEASEAAEHDTTESLQVVFSLLSTILASPEFSMSHETSELLGDIKEKLDLLLPHLPPTLSKPGTTASMLLEIQLTSPENDGPKGKKSSEIPDFEIHRRALVNLNSEHPPVQAEGFSLISDLIKKSSPILDIPSTLTLLLSIITDSSQTAASDAFIYLNAIKLIGTLASRHPRTVVKTLIDRYIDRSENATLDQRLKIGEALLRTIQELSEALAGETAKALGDGLITVAGRRAQKPQAQKSRKEAIEKERRKGEHEERQNQQNAAPGWELSSPQTSKILEEILDEDDSESETPEQATRSANIISAWAAGSSRDDEPDDLRVRASALSILATAVQTNIIGLGPSILSSAVDLTLATLTLEPEEESAILRRAGAVLLLDILKALDAARESRGSHNIGFGFTLADDSSYGFARSAGSMNEPTSIGNIPHILRTVGAVEARETDAIVRGHLRVLTESMEAWAEKAILWGIGHQTADQPQLELGDQIAGLRINPLAGASDAGRPRIEEIEEMSS